MKSVNTTTALLRAFLMLSMGVLLIGHAAAGNFAYSLDKHGLALRGHDPVSYFDAGKPVMGDPAYSVRLDGATYHFTSAANRDRFIAAPDDYRPKYGGYCAFGVSLGVKVNGDPQAWKIVNGKLYIQSSLESLGKWSKDIPGNIDKADGFWPKIRDMDPDKL